MAVSTKDQKALAAAVAEAGGHKAFWTIGSTYRVALVRSEALRLIFVQDQQEGSFAWDFTTYVTLRLDLEITAGVMI